MRRHIAVLLVLLAGGCVQLTCSKAKRDSIEHTNLGIEAANTGANAMAEKELREALRLDPSNHGAAYVLGQVYASQEKWDLAVEALAQAVKFNPKQEMYHQKLGEAYFKAENLDMAQAEFEAAVKIEDRLYKAHYYLGLVLDQQGDSKRAAEELSKSATLAPTFGPAFAELGAIYYRWDFYDEAVSVLTVAAENVLDADHLTNVYFYLGMAQDGKDMYGDAIMSYKKSLELKPDNVEAKLMLGLVYFKNKEYEQCQKTLQEYLKVQGNRKDQTTQLAQRYLGEATQRIPLPTTPGDGG